MFAFPCSPCFPWFLLFSLPREGREVETAHNANHRELSAGGPSIRPCAKSPPRSPHVPAPPSRPLGISKCGHSLKSIPGSPERIPQVPVVIASLRWERGLSVKFYVTNPARCRKPLRWQFEQIYDHKKVRHQPTGGFCQLKLANSRTDPSTNGTEELSLIRLLPRQHCGGQGHRHDWDDPTKLPRV